MYKFFSFFLLILFVLSSCGGSDTEDGGNGLSAYNGGEFSIQIPSSWEIIEEDDTLPNPSNGVIELAANSIREKGGFKNNLLVLSDTLSYFTTSADFSIENNASAVNDYVEYNPLDSKEIVFSDDEKSTLFVFEAKYNSDAPSVKFLQTAHVCNQNRVFLLTVAL